MRMEHKASCLDARVMVEDCLALKYEVSDNGVPPALFVLRGFMERGSPTPAAVAKRGR